MIKPALKQVIQSGLLIFGSLLFLFVAGELGLRVLHRFKTPTFELDSRLGWRTVRNLNFEYTTVDIAGVESTVHLQTNPDGFRKHDGDSDAEPRILIIGDSFTFAKDVSLENTYYAHMQNALGGAYYVFGSEGYNTQQEYFILDEVFDAVRPDIVLWQFCWNDYIANVPELEAESYINNNGYRRPYRSATGDIHYSNPKGTLHTLALKHSRVLYSLLSRADLAFGWSMPDVTIESIIQRDGLGHEGFQQSVDITRDILRDVKSRYGDVPLYLFAIDNLEPYYTVTQNLCRDTDIVFIGGVGEKLRESEVQGNNVRAGDGGHWNASGHQIAAEVLTAYLKEHIPERASQSE